MASIIVVATDSAVWSTGRCSRIVNRVLRSTSVPIALAHSFPQDQITFPMPGYRPVFGFGRAVADGVHIVELAAALLMSPGLARGTFSRQALVQISAQLAPSLHVEALVDRFVAHLRQLVIRVVAGQHIGDQLRTPPVVHPVFDLGAQCAVLKLEFLGPLGFQGSTRMCHPSVVIAVGVAVALYLAPHDATVTADLLSNLLIRLPSVAAAHDRDALIEAESMPIPTWPVRITRLSQTRGRTRSASQGHRPSFIPPPPTGLD
ncbi:hypothetical protein MINS_22880 [Mycolicibacterium insubricum]|nr:hypothetical protein MINS_22880 [Mycolicibacterium insubricum]